MPGNDRDQNFEKALAGNVRSSNAAPGNDCLDAETLAAYHDRLLDPEEMAQRKAHIATCERCQEILAQLEATDAIPVEADRDLMLDQIVLDLPETAPAPAQTPVGTAEQSAVPAGPAPPAETALPLESSSQAETEPESEAEQLSEAEAKTAPGSEFILDPKLLHDPEFVPASAPAPSSESSRAETAAVPVVVAAAKMTPASSHTITFRSPRQERPKMVRFVAIAGVLAAGLVLWFVYQGQNKQTEIALNQSARKMELPPQSPAQAPQPETKSEDKTANAQSTEPNAAPQAQARTQSQTAAAPPAAQSQLAPSKTPGDSMSDSLADAKKTLDTAKALEKKSRRDASGVMLDQPENTASPTAPLALGHNGLMAARAVTGSATPRAPRSLDATQSSADASHPANAPSGISATPPPARTKMNPSVVTESDALSPTVTQVSGATSGEFVTKPTSGRIASAALAPLSVPAPSGTTIWRIGQAGVIQRSADSGTTWFIQPSGVVADLIAGSAYSDQVCWLVGRNGTVLRTTNGGATWQKLTSPSSVDLLGVFSINADSATVTDAAGRAFETTTAGAHWTRTKLQN
jgi:hypothetical protein